MTNYDTWAAHAFLHSPQRSEKAVIDYLLNRASSPYDHTLPDLSARITLTALALVGDKEYARSGTRRDPGGLSKLYQSQSFQTYLHTQWQQCHALLETSPDLALLPTGSFSIAFCFTLSAAYISKDDTALHLLDNPVKKEWVFKLPYVASTQWKGSLRHALWQMGCQEEDEQSRRLFGTANEEQPNEGKRGRLYFYPTFFDRLSLEVINPHDRATGAGSQPILMEAVPAGATGTFTLLYVPFDRIGEDEAETRRQVAADLQLVSTGMQAIMTFYGFGAKTSSGFGLARENLAGEGVLVLNYPDRATNKRPARPIEPAQPAELKAFLATFPDEDFKLKPKEWREQRKATNRQRDAYIVVRQAREQYQQAMTYYRSALALWQAAADTPVPLTTERKFDSLAELEREAHSVAEMLQRMEGDI